jgi:hypothetical protein
MFLTFHIRVRWIMYLEHCCNLTVNLLNIHISFSDRLTHIYGVERRVLVLSEELLSRFSGIHNSRVGRNVCHANESNGFLVKGPLPACIGKSNARY